MTIRVFVTNLVTSVVLSTVACGGGSRPINPGPTPTPTPTAPGTPSNAPPASAGHSLVYATHLGMVVLVNAGLGGVTSPAASTPTRLWGWTGSEWQLLDSSGPPIRNLAGVTYDTRRQTLVMYGGTYDLGRSYAETWEWSGGWRQVPASGPGIRDHTQLAFDAGRGRAVLFGGSGSDPNAALPDTWEFDGVVWTRAATGGPAGRVHHALHYDPGLRRVVLFGGNSPGAADPDDTWAWDGSLWTRAGSSPRRSHASMTFHPGLGGLVVAGGFGTAGLDMLVNRGGVWTPVPSASDPGPRYLTGLAYDERRGVMVMFGGGAGSATLFDDTWEYDGTWRRVR